MATSGISMSEVTIDRTFDLQNATAVYPSLGTAYLMQAYSFSCSPALVRTGKDCYDSWKILAEMIVYGGLPRGTRFMMPAEGLAIEDYNIRLGNDPRGAMEFREYFGIGTGHKFTPCMFEWTPLVLRVPPGVKVGEADAGTGKFRRQVITMNIAPYLDQIADRQFRRENWRDIISQVDRIEGDIEVPAGGGMVIVEHNRVFGTAQEVREIPWPHKGYHSHWRFNASPRLDTVSGQYDVAVERGCYWPRGEDERCLHVYAYYSRSNAYPDDGFRPVRGSVSEIKRYDIAKPAKNER